MDGKATENSGRRYSRQNLIELRDEIESDTIELLVEVKEALQEVPKPKDHAGVEKAVKAIGAFHKLAREIFDDMLSEKHPADTAEKEDMNDDGDRVPAHNDDRGWRDLLRRQLVALNERKSAVGNDRDDAAGKNKVNGLANPESSGASGTDVPGRRLA